jgi:hypothetical protein
MGHRWTMAHFWRKLKGLEEASGPLFIDGGRYWD